MQAKRKNGFTLIELVIVIAILGILAGLAIPRFLDSRAQAQGAKLLGDLRTIDSAISIYQARTGSYPESLDILVTENYLASIPSSPTGSMLITTNKGSEKSYTSADADYKLTDTRATYSSSELNKGTVEQYLEGGNSGMTNPSPAGATKFVFNTKDYKLGSLVFDVDGIIYECIEQEYSYNTYPEQGWSFYGWKAVGTMDGSVIDAGTAQNFDKKVFAAGTKVLYNGNYYTCNGNVDGTGHISTTYKYEGKYVVAGNGKSATDCVFFDASNTSNWKQN